MDKKTKILLGIFLFCLFCVIVFAYVRFYVARDYSITSEIECDPQEESCFVYHCEEDCENEPEVSYYKIQTVEASALPLCNPHETECPEILCRETPTCIEILCSEETVPEGGECSEPVATEESDILTPIELPGIDTEQSE